MTPCRVLDVWCRFGPEGDEPNAVVSRPYAMVFGANAVVYRPIAVVFRVRETVEPSSKVDTTMNGMAHRLRRTSTPAPFFGSLVMCPLLRTVAESFRHTPQLQRAHAHLNADR